MSFLKLHYLDPIPQPELAPPLPAEPAPIDDRKNAVVDLLDVLLVVFVTGAAFAIFGIIAIGLYAYRHSLGPGSPELRKALEHNIFYTLSTQFAAYTVVVGFMAFLVWARHQSGLGRAIRWNTPRPNQALMAVFGGVALALFADVGEFLLHRWTPKSLPIEEYFKDRPSAFMLAAFGILVAPLVEELFFRGFLYPALSRWTRTALSVAVTAAAFASLHGAQLGFAWAPLLVLFVVGVVLTTVRAVGKSVAICVMVHMAYNFTLFTQLYFATKGFRDFNI